MNFKQWLQIKENGTSTGDVAVFAQPLMMSTNKKIVDEKKGKKIKLIVLSPKK